MFFIKNLNYSVAIIKVAQNFQNREQLHFIATTVIDYIVDKKIRSI